VTDSNGSSRGARGQRVSRAPTALERRAGTRQEIEVNYGAAGLVAAAGLPASGAAALAAAAGLSAGAAADAAASGAGAAGSSDLLQAVAKNIETSARSRTLRIAFSLV
jgi:hypothetical protein